ncbi:MULTISPECIES: response regulator transcription factor [unclassified Bradyrhizobium]|uniref:response regulator transcription factor n=1 Tax=unclassified Bradyrhizobium TaxID=2631580 RepID=UPI0020B3BD72|nr:MULTISPECIES: response regulator [unclassified Bradyrhizobium]MCP3382660.1 response regulator transcription factor [Bradyrhizobium sp. CCGUVB4N]MCP3443746.1 response regulator transcription factor [Bradyrhizobium sp. CCGUVB14]
MVLADDHVMVAEGLGRLVGEVADLVAQVADGKQLVEAVQRLKPDIVVSDVTMPVMSGLDALRQLKTGGSKARFIFLTVHADPQLATQAIREGACGYLLKAAAGEELIDAIRAVMAERIYLTPHITRDVLQTMSRTRGDDRPSLSPRQLELLRLIAQGKRMKEIAAQLNISVRTVEDHKSQLLAALGAKSTADLVKFAVKQGLIPE